MNQRKMIKKYHLAIPKVLFLFLFFFSVCIRAETVSGQNAHNKDPE